MRMALYSWEDKRNGILSNNNLCELEYTDVKQLAVEGPSKLKVFSIARTMSKLCLGYIFRFWIAKYRCRTGGGSQPNPVPPEKLEEVGSCISPTGSTKDEVSTCIQIMRNWHSLYPDICGVGMIFGHRLKAARSVLYQVSKTWPVRAEGFWDLNRVVF